MSVLTQPIFSLADHDDPVDLPTLLHRVWCDEVEGFSGLQAWQEHAWHAFLVQLAALAVPNGQWPASPEGWRDALLGLTSGAHGPWSLVVSDAALPALLQPPVPDLAALKHVRTTPDAIDLPVTAKAHDQKPSRMRSPRAEHWVYALVSLQTTEGFSGRGNYGIVRMNGGFGNRPYASVVTSLRWGPRVVRDASLLVEHASDTARKHGYALAGHRLLWLSPWDGTEQIAWTDCHPWCIEVCRRVRLASVDGEVEARVGSSKKARVDCTVEGGDVGDPWTAVERTKGLALTLASTGWRYDKLVQLINDYRLPLSMEPLEAPGAFLGRALVRGQGKTEGFHERLVPHPGDLMDPLADETVGDLAEQRVKEVSEATKALSAGLRKFLAAGGDSNASESRHRPWLNALQRQIDECFFPFLWDLVQAEDREKEDRRWAHHLHDLARDQLEDCFASAPFPDGRRLRAVATAETIFEGSFRKKFPNLYAPEAVDAS